MTTPAVVPPYPAAAGAAARDPMAPTRRRFTVAEYDAMTAAGILTEDDRVELLDGEIIQMPPIGEWHNGTAGWLNNALVPAVQGSAMVSVQGPLRLDEGAELQPDVLLLRYRSDFYRSRKPGPADVLLLIEISDTTLAYDRGPKLAAYARAGIPEVWIASRDDRRVETYREPVDGSYAAVRHFAPGQRVGPRAFPDIELAVADIIPEDCGPEACGAAPPG